MSRACFKKGIVVSSMMLVFISLSFFNLFTVTLTICRDALKIKVIDLLWTKLGKGAVMVKWSILNIQDNFKNGIFVTSIEKNTIITVTYTVWFYPVFSMRRNLIF